MVEVTAGNQGQLPEGTATAIEEASPGTSSTPTIVAAAKSKKAARPPPTLNNHHPLAEMAGQQQLHTTPDTVDAGAPVTAVVEAGGKPAVNIDFSFEESLEMTVAVFAEGWSLAPTFKLEYSLDEAWPGKNLIRQLKNAASGLQGLVHIALWKLGAACDEGIQPEKFIVSVLEPRPQAFAHPGPAAEKAIRDRTHRRNLFFDCPGRAFPFLNSLRLPSIFVIASWQRVRA